VQANLIGDFGLQGLVALGTGRTLLSLTLNVQLNRFGDTGTQWLMQLKESTILRQLSLYVAGNYISRDWEVALQVQPPDRRMAFCVHLTENGYDSGNGFELHESDDPRESD
jgi:hypothetical protein